MLTFRSNTPNIKTRSFFKETMRYKEIKDYDKRSDNWEDHAYSGEVYNSAGFGKSVPAYLQCSRQHHRRSFCGKRGTGSCRYLQSYHNTDDLIFKWSVHGCQYFNGNAVWGKRLWYSPSPDQYHYDFGCGLFRYINGTLRYICSAYIAADPGRPVNFGPDSRISADHILGIDVYIFI